YYCRYYTLPTTEARKAIASVERAQHRQDRRLIRCHHGLLEFSLPGGHRGHRREIAAGHHEDLDLRPIDPGECIACVLWAEPADRIRVGRAKSLEHDRVEPVLRLEIAGGTLVDRIRIGRHDGDTARSEGPNGAADRLRGRDCRNAGTNTHPLRDDVVVVDRKSVV